MRPSATSRVSSSRTRRGYSLDAQSSASAILATEQLLLKTRPSAAMSETAKKPARPKFKEYQPASGE